jgi:hypothetical protein
MTKAAPATPSLPATKVAELYGLPTFLPADWKTVVPAEHCPFLSRTCRKTRKSDPTITIGTCTMLHGRQKRPMIICPFRLLERRQIFHDCVHLLKLHEPGNELQIVAEVSVPGGSVDYCLVSVRDARSETSSGSSCRRSTPRGPFGRSGNASCRRTASRSDERTLPPTVRSG